MFGITHISWISAYIFIFTLPKVDLYLNGKSMLIVFVGMDNKYYIGKNKIG